MIVAQGIKAPRTFTVRISATAGGDVDLSLVSAVSLSIKKPGGAEATWTASVISQSATALSARHTFASDGTDCQVLGEYRGRAWMTVPGGTLESDQFHFTVKE